MMADSLRAVLVSLAFFFVALIVTGLVQTWRQRRLPAPPNFPPFWEILLFAASYVLLLMHSVVERWRHLGEPEITPPTWLVLIALTLNVLATARLILHSRSPQLAPLTWRGSWIGIQKFVSARQAVDRARMQVSGKSGDLPSRWEDGLTPRQLVEITNIVERQNGEISQHTLAHLPEIVQRGEQVPEGDK
jgi:hypothetical protein